MADNALQVTNNANTPMAYNQEQINTIKNTVAKGATDDELKMFLHLCQKYQLDPFLKEIWFIKRAKKTKDRNGNWDYKRLPDGNVDYSGAETMMMTSRDGYLRVAQDDKNFDGIKSFVVKEGDVFEVDAQTDQVIHKFGIKRGRILGAWSAVYHKQRRPVICFAEFSEYNDDKSTTWKKYPSAMIMKVSEVLALKRQFGISGLITQEELTTIAEQENVIEISNTETLALPESKSQEDSEKPTATEITQNSIKAIHAMRNELSKTEEELKQWISKGLGREITSLKQLTESEALVIREKLNVSVQKARQQQKETN